MTARRRPNAPSDYAALALAAWDALRGASSLVFDLELRYVVARGLAPAMHGAASDNLEGQLAQVALPAERWNAYEPLYRAALRGQQRAIEFREPHTARLYRVDVGPLRASAGVVGGVAVATDITAERTAEQRHRALFESAPQAILAVDGEGVIVLANAVCERLFGYPPGALLGRAVELLVPGRSGKRHRSDRAAFATSRGSRTMHSAGPLLGRRLDGSEFAVDIGLSTFETEQGVFVTAVIAALETRHRHAESLLLVDVLQAIPSVGFIFVDRDLRIRRINDTLAAMGDGPPGEQVGRLAADVVPELWPQLKPAYEHVLATGEASVGQGVDVYVPEDSGPARTFLASFYPVHVADKLVGVGALAVDVTDRREAAEFRQAVMDTMSEGLYTQDSTGRLTYINAAAAKMLGYAEDELRGQVMHDAVHYQHVDGTSFPIEECELRKSQLTGRSIRKSDDAFIRKDGTLFPVSYSAEVLRLPHDDRGLVVLFRDTSAEHVEELRVKQELETLSWVGRVRDALDEDRLVLYSQPILPLRGGVPSEELLVRLIGRDGEVILPGRFLPASEKYGLIREIDLWVISQAIRLAADGRHVHANLSADSVSNPDLLLVIARGLRESGADPAKLGFELTETALMSDIAAGEAFARGLAGIGCTLALDDFGTGFGSLTYLKRLPFSYLKIDIEFVRDLATHVANQKVVQGIIYLANGFGYRTIAEGIEDAETLELLRGYGVDFAQGYHVGRPAPLAASPSDTAATGA